MALSLSSNPNFLTNKTASKTLRPTQWSHSLRFRIPISFNTISILRVINATARQRCVFRVKAVEESAESETVKESKPADATETASEAEEIGAEIKKAMMERKKEEKEGGELLSGVAEEIGEIEWPAFGKVLGTTGVVIAVIAGSSVVLLTVNAVLAELSDRVFAGRGIQDFF